MRQRLLAGGLGSPEVAAHGGEERVAAGTRCLRPRTSELPTLGLQWPRQRPCGPKLPEAVRASISSGGTSGRSVP
jgi:hypothetical protein